MATVNSFPLSLSLACTLRRLFSSQHIHYLSPFQSLLFPFFPLYLSIITRTLPSQSVYFCMSVFFFVSVLRNFTGFLSAAAHMSEITGA
ncbi:hypothetical protein C8Q75DRAFT_310492 [Abortiporus biennis]|nr:hypothetical protein C8Q75DRAFT_310492 [Abortiporus biennis]